MLYMVTFTINIPPMLAYIPYMDPMGFSNLKHWFFQGIWGASQKQTLPFHHLWDSHGMCIAGCLGTIAMVPSHTWNFPPSRGLKKKPGRKEYLLTEGAALSVLNKYLLGCILAPCCWAYFALSLSCLCCGWVPKKLWDEYG